MILPSNVFSWILSTINTTSLTRNRNTEGADYDYSSRINTLTQHYHLYMTLNANKTKFRTEKWQINIIIYKKGNQHIAPNYPEHIMSTFNLIIYLKTLNKNIKLVRFLSPGIACAFHQIHSKINKHLISNHRISCSNLIVTHQYFFYTNDFF